MDDKGIGVSGPGAALLLEDPVGAVERLFASRRQPSSRVVADIHVRMPRAGKSGSLRRLDQLQAVDLPRTLRQRSLPARTGGGTR